MKTSVEGAQALSAPVRRNGRAGEGGGDSIMMHLGPACADELADCDGVATTDSCENFMITTSILGALLSAHSAQNAKMYVFRKFAKMGCFWRCMFSFTLLDTPIWA